MKSTIYITKLLIQLKQNNYLHPITPYIWFGERLLRQRADSPTSPKFLTLRATELQIYGYVICNNKKPIYNN